MMFEVKEKDCYGGVLKIATDGDFEWVQLFNKPISDEQNEDFIKEAKSVLERLRVSNHAA